ncbi:MAG: 2-amino-4-hydroxy-6-hydroxymethyldihydropteridine diphosphokinase [Woeseia sp.]
MKTERPHWWPAYVGIGSNLDSPASQVEQALKLLAAINDTILTARSGLYRSAPVGPAGQPDFINAAAALVTRLSAPALLEQLQIIETAQGRVRDGERWGPRCLDLDLLVYSSHTMKTPDLELPHPRIAERNFVLLPLSEIASHVIVPGLKSVGALAADVSRSTPRIEKIDR